MKLRYEFLANIEDMLDSAMIDLSFSEFEKLIDNIKELLEDKMIEAEGMTDESSTDGY